MTNLEEQAAALARAFVSAFAAELDRQLGKGATTWTPPPPTTASAPDTMTVRLYAPKPKRRKPKRRKPLNWWERGQEAAEAWIRGGGKPEVAALLWADPPEKFSRWWDKYRPEGMLWAPPGKHLCRELWMFAAGFKGMLRKHYEPPKAAPAMPEPKPTPESPSEP